MSLPQASLDIKLSIASSYPDFEARATTAWHEIIKELDKLAEVTFKFTPRQYIPQISFNSLACLSQGGIAKAWHCFDKSTTLRPLSGKMS